MEKSVKEVKKKYKKPARNIGILGKPTPPIKE
jgi:hypothetical protein